MTTLTDAEIAEIADRTKSAEPGRDGYILPNTFARAIEAAILAAQAKQAATGEREALDAWHAESDRLKKCVDYAPSIIDAHTFRIQLAAHLHKKPRAALSSNKDGVGVDTVQGEQP